MRSSPEPTPGRPPRLAAWLVSRLAPRHDREELLGDLEERYQDSSAKRGRRWYWRQALGLAAGISLQRLRRIRLPRPRLLWDDFRLAFRSLRREPALMLAGMLTLGIGIGAPSTLFAILDGFMLPLPVRDSDRVVDVSLFDFKLADDRRVPRPVFEAWRNGQSSFRRLGAYFTDTGGVSSKDGPPERYAGAYLTLEVLEILEVKPVAGRLFNASDMAEGAAPTVLISEKIWQERFDRRQDAFGAELRINGVWHTVLGVLPDEFAFPVEQRIWMPLESHPYQRPALLRLLGRLTEGRSPGQAAEELESLYAAYADASGQEGDSMGVLVEEYVTARMGANTVGTLRNLIRVVCLLVLVAAVNVAGLLLARGAARSRDLALRMAIGGGRRRVIGQMLTESFVLAVGGGLLGLLAAYWGAAWARTLVEGRLPYWARLEVSPSLVGFTFLLVIVAALASGLTPALRSSRLNLSEALKRDHTRSSMRMGRTVPVIVGVEMALSCALLILSSLIVLAAFQNARSAPFSSSDVLTARFVLEDYDYPDPAARLDFLARFQSALDSQPGLRDASLASHLPGKEASRILFRSQSQPPQDEAQEVQRRLVSPSFFDMFGLRLERGRLLRTADQPGMPDVAVVNREFVRRYLPQGPALGHRLVLGSGSSSATVEIVGVVSDPGVTVEDGASVPGLYLPLAQHVPEAIRVALRPRDGADALPVLRRALAAADPALPMEHIRTLQEVERRENAEEQLFGTLFTVFGLVTLLLSAVGLQGVVSFNVSQRRREIGIRRVLGAAPARVFWSTTLQGLRPAFIGMIFGIGMALLIAPLLAEAFYGMDPHEPAVFSLVSLGLLAVCVLAALAPARRASRLDPIVVLKAE